MPTVTKPRKAARRYWLFKSEPDSFSWDAQKAEGARGGPWTGVRNYQARNVMREMRAGDLGFFYHSGDAKEIVGIVRVIAPAHADPTDDSETWECVDVAAMRDLPNPVTLAEVKANRKLKDMALATKARLSVQPVTSTEWREVCRMGGVESDA